MSNKISAGVDMYKFMQVLPNPGRIIIVRTKHCTAKMFFEPSSLDINLYTSFLITG